MAPDERYLDPDIGRRGNARPVDAVIGELAGRQHGVVALSRLRELGLARGAIDHRLPAGRLLAVHREVYAVGHRAVTQRGRWMAAVLSGGPNAVLSHRAAAALSGLRASGPLEVTAPRQRRAGTGVVAHRSSVMADERTVRDGIPVTAVPRTLLDLAAIEPRSVARAAHEAEGRRSPVARRPPGAPPRRRGTAVLRRLREGERLGAELAKSELEARFLHASRRAGLP